MASVIIQSIMYFGIGFLAAALFGLLFVPLVHNRAIRLTTRRLEAAMPLSIAEMRADKDHLRAQTAMSIRRLEISIAKMKTKTATHLVAISKKTETINRLTKECGEKTATIDALEARDKTLRDQLCAAEERLELQSESLRKAECTFSDNEAELTKQVVAIADKGRLLDERKLEIERLQKELEAVGRLVTERVRSEIDRLESLLPVEVNETVRRDRGLVFSAHAITSGPNGPV